MLQSEKTPHDDKELIRNAIRLLRIETKNRLADYCVETMAALNRIIANTFEWQSIEKCPEDIDTALFARKDDQGNWVIEQFSTWFDRINDDGQTAFEAAKAVDAEKWMRLPRSPESA